MPRYISLVNWTEKGAADVKNAVNRLQQARKLVEKHGGRIECEYFTMGPFDFVVVAEYPNDEAANRVILEIGRAGYARSVTLKGWTADEFEKTVSGLS